MTEEINLDEVMSRRFELDEQITAIQNKNKADLAPLLEEMQLCESYIKAVLIKTNQQIWKSSLTGHKVHWTTKDSVTVEDMKKVIHRILAESPLPPPMLGGEYEIEPEGWKAILNHIAETGLWALLNKAVNKTTTREVLESGSEVPGVKLTSFRDLVWSRGKV